MRAGALSIALPAFVYAGPQQDRWVADSLSTLVRSRLEGHPDFRILDSGAARAGASLVLQGRVEVRDREVRVGLEGTAQGPAPAPAAQLRLPLDAWPALADSVAYAVLLSAWDSKSPLASSLPLRGLPRTPAGLARFFEAEQLVAGARWGEARAAYAVAEAADSTCWLCSWRLTEVERWLSQEHDPARTRRYLSHIDSFPPWYQSLMRASQVPLPARLDTLRRAVERSPNFFLAWFQLGDELLHRGPLAGYRRAEAIAPLETAVRLRPDFAPGWEHLAWVQIAEGDSGGAARALHALARGGEARDAPTLALRALLRTAFAWRFMAPAVAEEEASMALREPGVVAYGVAAGPRFLMAFEAPNGAIGLGRILASMPNADLRRSGRIAEWLGLLAAGRAKESATSGAALAAEAPESETALSVAELSSVLALVERDTQAAVQALPVLRRFLSPGVPVVVRRRATWTSILVQRRFPRHGEVPPRFQYPDAGDLERFLRADSLAALGRYRDALNLTDSVQVDSAARYLEPAFRSIARLLRAEWSVAAGDREGARRDLVWAEHWNVVGLPIGLPQAAEIDWAFSTVAYARRADLLAEAGSSAELCRALAGIRRNWARGDAAHAARARAAGARYQAIACGQRR
jgi:hypothetical protein